MAETMADLKITNLAKRFDDFVVADAKWKENHEETDERGRSELRSAVAGIKATQDSQTGGIGMAKWMIGLGIPAIIAMLGLLLARHP